MRKMCDNIRLYHADHLGSTSLVTDIDGEITQHVAYIPYGEVFVEQRNGSWSTPYLFNAKELDEETGLYYYGARYLDPTHAAWLSVDPLFEKYVGMTPYGYCAGNPVKLIDPDGREVITSLDLRKPAMTGKNAIKDHNRYFGNLGLKFFADHYNDSNNPRIINVLVHGLEGGKGIILEDGTEIRDPMDLFNFLAEKSTVFKEDYLNNKGVVIVLHSCQTAKGEKSFAQQFSELLGKQAIVIAPTDNIQPKEYLFSDGMYEIIQNEGSWNFYQGGNLFDVQKGYDPPFYKFWEDDAIQMQDYLKDKSYDYFNKRNKENKAIPNNE